MSEVTAMAVDEYGPVPISRLRSEFDEVLGALAAGRRVMVSRHGEVIAVIEPRAVLSPLLLSEYTAPSGPPLASLSARGLNQVGASALIARAVDELEPCFVTSNGSLYGAAVSTQIARGIDVLGPDRARSLQRHVDRFLAEHPDATDEDTAEYVASLEGSGNWPSAGVVGPTPWEAYRRSVQEAYQQARFTGVIVDESTPAEWVERADGTRSLVVRDADQLIRAASAGNVRAILDLGRSLVGAGEGDLAVAVFRRALYNAPDSAVADDYVGAPIARPARA